MKGVKRALSLLLALGLLAALAPPVARAAEGAEEITVSSAEELRALAKNCALDTWSQGKTVRLTADIDLTGQVFSPVPTFGGTFLGEGHTISGINLTAGGSNMGLFRFVQKGAVIRDLHVSGRVAPGGSGACVGGVAGSNEGTIQNCSFQGAVRGESAVGGIAGSNGPGGVLARCSTAGAVTGRDGTGGIAGRNDGLLLDCENSAAVNTSPPGPAAGLEGLNVEGALSQLATPAGGEESERLLSAGSHTDTGGVVGYSAGVVRGCSNAAAVGYSHVGYNVGGVAGRQAGYMEGCANSGAVRGRKDVGGVIGQAEPDVTLNAGEDELSRLRGELSTLSGLIGLAIDHAELSRANISGRLLAMAENADSARDSASLLLERAAGFADENLDAADSLRAAVATALEGLSPAWEGLGGVSGKFGELCDELEGAFDQLQDDGRLGREALDAARGAVRDLRWAGEGMETAVQSLYAASDALRRAVVLRDRAAVSAAAAELAASFDRLGEAAGGAGDAVAALREALRGGVPGDGEAAAALEKLARAIGGAGGALRRIGVGLGTVGENVGMDWSQAYRALSLSLGALDALGAAAGEMTGAMDALHGALAAAGPFAEALGDAAGRFGGAVGLGSEMGEGLRAVFDTLDRVTGALAADGAVELTPLGGPAREAGNALFSALSGLSGDMEALRAEADRVGESLSADLKAVNRQLERTFLLALELLDDTRTAPELSGLVGDASDEDLDAARPGKAEGCTNLGSVEGDRNVGGVAGAMAIEYDLDPEDDAARFAFGSYYEIRAVLRGCVNHGAVTGRRDCVGGLAGRVDLGTVAGCENYGYVKSSGGSYVGGVAGYCGAAVRECRAKCGLAGENYVGGVAGWAARMTDCRALVVVDGGAQCVGSIAGGADLAGGEVRGNFFVDMGVAGVDGVSYAGAAEPIAYERLMALPDIPAGFGAFTLTLRANGETVAQFPFRYGEDLRALSLPEVPEREGFYGAWPEFDRSGTRSDLTVDAVYTPWVTLAASARREGKRPLVLAEGRFTADVSPEVRDSALDPPDGEGCDIWEITLAGAELGEADTVPLRLLNRSGGKAQVLQYAGGKWEPVDSSVNGHYLLLTMTGPSATFCIRPVPGVSPLVPGLLLAAAGLCILLAAVGRRKGAKRKTEVSS